jgi:AAA+ ATPase superfamily predicted ATPase
MKQYDNPGSNLVILYGRKGIGKTSLLKEFMEGRPAFYYNAVECEERMQYERMTREWKADGIVSSGASDYTLLFSTAAEGQLNKTIIILDEFQYLARNGSGLLEAINNMEHYKSPVMMILCSSSVRFIENEMVGYLGASAGRINSYLKLKEFTFVDFVNRFLKTTVENCIYINAILGGVPDYLEEWQEDKTVKDNILEAIIDKNRRLFSEPQNFLKQELREPAVYNTILASLAAGNRKLNELYRSTGYSRAKILVYLKHLTELDIVEKLVPISEEGKENAKKGLYRIKDHYLHFWYCFVFPNLSELQLGKKTYVYDQSIKPRLNEYMEEYFADVCMEFLKLMNQHQRLSVKYQWWDRWYGKNGTIDILAKGPAEETLVGKCIWEDRITGMNDYYSLISLSKEAGLSPNCYYLFSKNGFTRELKDLSASQTTINLIGLEDL